MKNFPFFFKLFRVKSLSVYQLTLIIIIVSSTLSIITISAGWVFTEIDLVQKEISLLKEKAIEKQKEKLHQEVLRLISYLDHIQQDTVQYSQEQIKDKALLYFESLRFGNDGYVFVNTYSGNALLFNGKKLEKPVKMSDLKYPSGINFYETEMNLAKLPDGGSFQYKFIKTNDTIQYPKISYIMGFDQWEWILGAGDYLDNLDSEIALMKNKLKNNLYRSILIVIGVFIPILILLLLFSTLVAKFIQNQFDNFVHIIKNPPPSKKNQLPFNHIYITDLKLIGKDILQADELVKQFGNIIDQSNNEIYIFRKDNLQFVHANKGAVQNCGYSINELQKMTFLDIMPDLNSKQFLTLVEPLKQKKFEKIQFESVYQRKNKTIYHVEAQLTLSFFNKNEVYIAFIYDITNSMQIKNALKESEELLQLSSELAYVAAWEYNFETDEMSRTKNHDKLYGLDIQKKWDFTTFINATHPDDRKLSNTIIQKSVVIGGPDEYKFDFRVIYPDGSIHWLNVIGKVIKRNVKGQGILVRGFLIDITERKKAEEALRESEIHFRQLFENNPQPMWIYDVESLQFKDVNKSALKKYGYSKEEFLSMTLKDIRPLEDITLLLKNIAESNDEFQDSGVWSHQLKDRTIILVEIFSHNMLFENKLARLVLVNDVTQRKQAEEEIAKHRIHLEKLVKERTIELEQSEQALLKVVDDLNLKQTQLALSNKKLAEINAEMETFTYSVSHDLKAPLRGIDGYSKLLIDIYEKDLNKEAKEFLGKIRSGTHQMNVLIEDLLAYSRLERQEFQINDVALQPLISELLILFTNEISTNNIQINTSILENFTLFADNNGLKLVLRNLIDNAIKFSVKSKNPRIEIGSSENSTHWLIFVKDNGVGFDMKYHNRIFKIFHRLHLPEEFDGTGIGLAMVEKAMHRMNGRIWAESALNKGTCFYIEFKK